MKFFKNGNKSKKVEVSCPCCSNKQEFEYSSVQILPTGYKGRISFFVKCNHCQNKVYVEEQSLSTKFVSEAYSKYLQ